MTDRLRSFATMTLVAVVSAAAVWFLREHWQPARGYLVYLPYILFFACPLMHLFMHHGRGDHRHDLLQDGRSQSPARRSPFRPAIRPF